MDVDALAEVMSKVHVNSHGVVDAAGQMCRADAPWPGCVSSNT